MVGVDLSEVLSRIKGVRRNGNGYMGLCPAHDDNNPSLSITEKNGKVLVHCFAGCRNEAVWKALNMSPIEETGMMAKTTGSEIVATYDYVDEAGNLLFQTVRCEPKKFRQRQPDGKGGWKWNLKGVPFVIYRLSDVLAAKLVYIVEGEKDVETLRSKGLTATCNPMGAGKWRDKYNEPFRGKNVVILPDSDEPGRMHAKQVAQSLHGIANEIVIVELPGLFEKGDLTDYFTNGGTVDDLQDLVGRAERWIPAANLSSKTNGFNFTPLSEMLEEPEEVTAYLWENTLPMGGFSICSAKPKVGKSTLARNLAARVVKGELFIGRGTTKGKVLLLCLEEKRSEIKRHFGNMGVNSEDILIHTGATPENALDELKSAIEDFKPSLVIIDPLSRVLRVRDFNDYGGMARGLEPFIDLARETGVHLMALHHDSKADRKGGDALLGSTALFGSVDTHLQLKKKENYRTLYSEQRYGEDIPETVLELDKESGIITAKGDLATIKIQEIETQILSILNLGTSMTESDLKEQINASSKGLISKALRSLFETGQIERSGEGKRGAPFIYSWAVELVG